MIRYGASSFFRISGYIRRNMYIYICVCISMYIYIYVYGYIWRCMAIREFEGFGSGGLGGLGLMIGFWSLGS